jgi:hypothetical protein
VLIAPYTPYTPYTVAAQVVYGSLYIHCMVLFSLPLCATYAQGAGGYDQWGVVAKDYVKTRSNKEMNMRPVELQRRNIVDDF